VWCGMLSIGTARCRIHAKAIVALLDPTGTLVGDRLIDQGGVTNDRIKGFKKVHSHCIWSWSTRALMPLRWSGVHSLSSVSSPCQASND